MTTLTDTELPEVLAALEIAAKVHLLTGDYIMAEHYQDLARTLSERNLDTP